MAKTGINVTIDVDDFANLTPEELEKQIEDSFKEGKKEIMDKVSEVYTKTAYNKEVVVVTFEKDMA